MIRLVERPAAVLRPLPEAMRRARLLSIRRGRSRSWRVIDWIIDSTLTSSPSSTWSAN